MGSEYEQERLKNIEENERLLRELGISSGGEVLGATPSKRPSDRDDGRARKRPERKPREKRVLPQRASARLQGVKLEPGDQEPVKPEPMQSAVRASRRHGDLDLASLAELEEGECKDLASILSVEPERRVSPPQSPLEEVLASMRLTSHTRVAQKRIYSMLYHPTLEKDLVFTGDQEGMLGIWDASSGDAENGIREGTAYQLQVHAKSIGALRFDPRQQDRIYSGSYDGSIRVFSLGAITSHEIWCGSDDVQLGEFDILSVDSTSHVIWAADHRGGLIQIDERSPSSARRWQASTKKIGGMSVWSREPHCIAAASNDRTVSLFDVRALRTVNETPLAPLKVGDDDPDVARLCDAARFGKSEYGMACTDVSFSPSGDHLAALSYDDTVFVWDTTEMYTKKETGKLTDWLSCARDGQLNDVLRQPITTLNHNNKTGKWVTLFRANWHPNAELQPHFAIRSMERHAEIYSPDGRLLASLYDPDWVTAIPAVTAMHPQVPGRLATGNGSGRCALWSPGA